jgi:hypothetical protein
MGEQTLHLTMKQIFSIPNRSCFAEPSNRLNDCQHNKFPIGKFPLGKLCRTIGVALAILGSFGLDLGSAASNDSPPPPAMPPAPTPQLGVSINEPKAFKGYTLLAPMNSTTTYLIDMEGRVVKTWQSEFTPGLSAHLLENGHLLRAGNLGPKGLHPGAGAGGRIQLFDWDGNLVWDYTHCTKTQQQHHDIHPLPNGNVLLIVWDKKTTEEAIAAGRRPDTITDGLLADAILEVKPTGKTTGEVVWEWHAWDHLVQDHDKTKANYGNVAARPELIDINFGSRMLANLMTQKDELNKLRDLGYVGSGSPAPGKEPNQSAPLGTPTADWLHTNSVAYNAELDQIMLSVHAFSEIWIIDHSTTTEQAAGHTGGRYGKGGDLLYRWGNPRAYRSGTNADQKLFYQHDAHWIPKGLPGGGHLLVFNNGGLRLDGSYSSVDELMLPIEANGQYTRKRGLPFGPDKPIWSYTAEKKTDFFALFISGAQRLPNGNTLICSGPDGVVFEVTEDKQTVWKFAHPIRGPVADVAFGEPPNLLVPPAVRDGLTIGRPLAELAKRSGQMTLPIAQITSPPTTGSNGGPTPGALFRCYRYGPNYPGLSGRELKPGKKLEEVLSATH